MELHVQPATITSYTAASVTQLANFLWVPCYRACFECGQDTTWVSYSFEAPLHPGVCEDAAWAKYFSG